MNETIVLSDKMSSKPYIYIITFYILHEGGRENEMEEKGILKVTSVKGTKKGSFFGESCHFFPLKKNFLKQIVPESPI